MIAIQSGRCYYCCREARLEIDHYIPVSRGGTNWPDNLRLACHGCNAEKGNKLVSEWFFRTSA